MEVNGKVAQPRQTRIDKDVKTTSRYSKLLSLLYDFMWSYRYFPYLACLLLVAETVIGYVIIHYVPYTEIDWKAYMQQVETFKAGERDYIKIRGDTGPLVYPAGFVYVFSVLHSFTDQGENIRRGMWLTLPGDDCNGLGDLLPCTCLSTVGGDLDLPVEAIAFDLFMRQKWRIGCAVFSFAVSIKMNVLLFAPALFFLLLQACGLLRTIWYLGICATIQVVLAMPFLRVHWFHYLLKAFELNRVFTYKWTVNWKFLPEDVFVSKDWAVVLLLGHLVFMVLFLQKHFNIVGTLRVVLYKPLAIYEPFPMRAEVIATSMFVINYVGICFARTLHYQFYAWFYPTLPYLVWKANIPLLFKMKAIIICEYAFNTFPATAPSSLALQLTNLTLLMMLYVSDDQHRYVAYLDADAREQLISFLNEECFDGARQLALYYGSVTEELAAGARTVSIDEREVILSLPAMKLTLAIGFGASTPVTTEGYGRQVLQSMLNEATEGIAAGENMGKIISREWIKEKERQRLDREATATKKNATNQNHNVRQRTNADV